MEVMLPSGHKAMFRDQFLAGDRREAKKALIVVISADGSRRMDGSITDDVAARVITRMLVSWDFPDKPVPRDATSHFLAEQILDSLDEADLAALEDAVQPWVARVLRTDGARVLTHVSGVQVTVASAADADVLAGYPDFSREGDADPKSGSLSTGTSSPGTLPRAGRKALGT